MLLAVFQVAFPRDVLALFSKSLFAHKAPQIAIKDGNAEFFLMQHVSLLTNVFI